MQAVLKRCVGIVFTDPTENGQTGEVLEYVTAFRNCCCLLWVILKITTYGT